MPASHSYQFGDFRLDAGGRVLLRGHDRVALTPKAIDLLIALVEARDRPVGKDELLRTVWPGVTVEEGSLTSHVFLLRKALGDGFIETLSKRGYRFIAPVAESSPPAAPAPVGSGPEPHIRLAIAPFESRGGGEPQDDFSDGLTEEVITQLARSGPSRWGAVARAAAAPDPSHRLEGSVRRADARVRITARLVRESDGSHLWAESYDRPLQDTLALQVDVAQAIARDVRTRLAPPRTLTFLFSSVDGEAAAIGTPPDTLLRDTIAPYGGRTLRAVEGVVCSAFADAATALQAAVETQRALSARSLPVRMGLHSGAVEDGEDEDFSGPTLARTARVLETAQAGQVLLTAATLAALDRNAPPGCGWRDLGDHTLRGFIRSERLYQLTAPGLRAEFPPIRTRETMRTNLPPSLTLFIGRQPELAEVGEHVGRSRMVTLVGAGGIGKTRLSLEAAGRAAADFPDGVWFVDLAPLTDPAMVARAIVLALGARAESDTPPMALVASALQGQRALLLLDNCEHVIDEAAQVAQALLRTVPELHLLATSRQPLGIEGETIYRVPSLTLPAVAESPSPPDVIASEAGQLFLKRATEVRPGFALTDGNAATIAQLCQRLDGIPLAIELAAARLTALSVEEIARRIDDRFRFLTGGLRTALPRQRTLRAMVDWSYDLLSAHERAVLNALAVFAGGCTLDAIERIATPDSHGGASVLDAVEQLVAKSLLIAETQDGAETRYRLLETIRQYAGEKLGESGLADTTRRRHFAYFASLAETGGAALEGPFALEWLDRLEAEHDNLRAALDEAEGKDARGHAQLAASLQSFWDIRGHYNEGGLRLERACALYTARDRVRLAALIGAGTLAFRLAQPARTERHLEEAVTLADELGEPGGEARATFALGHARRQQGGDACEPLLSRAVVQAKAAGDRRLEGMALVELGRIALTRGEYAEAERLCLDGEKRLNEAGCVIEAPTALMYAGHCALHRLDFVTARRVLEDTLVQHRRNGYVHEAADALRTLGYLALQERRLDEARALTSESLDTFRALHDPKCVALTSVHLADVLGAVEDWPTALAHAQAAAETYRGLDLPFRLAQALFTIGRIHAATGQSEAARNAVFDGLVQQRRAPTDTYLPDMFELAAGLHPDAPAAARLLGAAVRLREAADIPQAPHERAESERWQAHVRARHAHAAFELEFAAGRRLTRDEAIEAALALGATSAV